MKKKITSLLLTLSLCIGVLAVPNTAMAAQVENQYLIPNEKVIIDCGHGEDDPTISIQDEFGNELYSLDKVNDIVYSTTYLNVRQRPTTLSTIKDTVVPGHKFYRIGHSDFGWDLVLQEEEFFFLWNEYITDEEPEEIDTRPINTEEYTPHIQEAEYSAEDFQYRGVIHWGGYKWTWYSELILPGGGLKIPGRHVDENGYICDENDYICLASSDLSKGTVVSTPFGKDGKIYDCGCASGTLDVYVHW